MIKTIIIIAGSAILATATVAAQTTEPAPSEAPTDTMAQQQNAAALGRGAKAWANNCSRCHNLRSPSELNAELWDVSVMHMRVRANIPGKVADDIRAFLMSSAESGASPTTPANSGPTTNAYADLSPGDPLRGGVVYSQTCIACHGVDGKGTIQGVPDFTAERGRLTKTDDVLLTNMINGYQSEGSIMAMPPKGGNPDLTEQDMADILAYLRKEFRKNQ